MFHIIAETVDAIREMLRRPTPPQVPPAPPPPEALYRDLIFEVFETGKDITYHDVSKPRPKDDRPFGTYAGEPIYDAPADMYRILDGDRHRYMSRYEYMERTAPRLRTHWVEVELRHAPTGAFLRHKRPEGSALDHGTFTVGHHGVSEGVAADGRARALRYFKEYWDRESKKADERAEAARMDRVRSFLPKFEAWLDAA